LRESESTRGKEGIEFGRCRTTRKRRPQTCSVERFVPLLLDKIEKLQVFEPVKLFVENQQIKMNSSSFK